MSIQAKEIKLVPLSEIKLNPKNRNKHPQEQIDRIVEIIRYQGFRRPVTISNLSGFLSCGEGRYLAAKKLKLTHIPAMFQDYESAEQEYADGIADNAIDKWAELDLTSIQNDLADLGSDFNLDMLGIKDFKLVETETLEPGCDEDAVPEHVEPKTKLGDLYKLGNHRLLCGDSTNIQHVERLMDGEKADMVFTDPPYGISYGGRGQNGATKGNDFGEILNDDSVQVAKDAFRLCVSLEIPIHIFWGANFYPSVFPDQKTWIVWDKQIVGDNYSACELAYTNKTGRIRKFTHQWHGMIKQSERGERRVHPTQKPVALAEWCFENYGKPKSVLDLFGGSGSTLIACEKTKRKAYLMELDPKYCDVIVARWEKYTGQKAELISG